MKPYGPLPPSKGDRFGFTHNDDRTLIIDCCPRVVITLTKNEYSALRWTAGGPEPIFGGVILDRGADGRWGLKLDRSTKRYAIECERPPEEGGNA